jgi:hypothetical protein
LRSRASLVCFVFVLNFFTSGTLDFDEFLYLYNKIKTSESGFLVEAKRKVDLAAVSGDNGFGIDMNKLNKKAEERRKTKAINREKNKLKASQKAELLKLGFSKKEIEKLKR